MTGEKEHHQEPAAIPADATLPLKHGGRRVNVQDAVETLESLQAFLEVLPRFFYDVLALARGNAKGVGQQNIDKMKAMGLLDRHSGVFRNHLDEVLLSAFRQGTEGAYIGDPFKAETAKDAQLVRAAEAERERIGGGADVMIALLKGDRLPQRTLDRLRELDERDERNERIRKAKEDNGGRGR